MNELYQHIVEWTLWSLAVFSVVTWTLYYLHNQWQHLINYVCDGDYHIDNNAADKNFWNSFGQFQLVA